MWAAARQQPGGPARHGRRVLPKLLRFLPRYPVYRSYPNCLRLALPNIPACRFQKTGKVFLLIQLTDSIWHRLAKTDKLLHSEDVVPKPGGQAASLRVRSLQAYDYMTVFETAFNGRPI